MDLEKNLHETYAHIGLTDGQKTKLRARIAARAEHQMPSRHKRKYLAGKITAAVVCVALIANVTIVAAEKLELSNEFNHINLSDMIGQLYALVSGKNDSGNSDSVQKNLPEDYTEEFHEEIILGEGTLILDGAVYDHMFVYLPFTFISDSKYRNPAKEISFILNGNQTLGYMCRYDRESYDEQGTGGYYELNTEEGFHAGDVISLIQETPEAGGRTLYKLQLTNENQAIRFQAENTPELQNDTFISEVLLSPLSVAMISRNMSADNQNVEISVVKKDGSAVEYPRSGGWSSSWNDQTGGVVRASFAQPQDLGEIDHITIKYKKDMRDGDTVSVNIQVGK